MLRQKHQPQVLGILLDPAPSKKRVQKNKNKTNQSELGPLRHRQVLRDKMFLRWGLSPSVLASFLGLTRPLPRAADWRGGGASASEILQGAI